MKKLMYVVNDSWYFVSHRLPIAQRMVQSGYKVYVVAKRDDSTKVIVAAGCQFKEWKLSPRGQNALAEFKAIIALFCVIRKINPDILHLITIKAVVYGGLIARLMPNTHVVIAVSGLGAIFEESNRVGKNNAIQQLYKLAINHKHAIKIFQNKDNLIRLQEKLNVTLSNTHLIEGSGVDLARYIPVDEPVGDPVVVLAARLLRDKGINEYIEAAKLLIEEGTVCKFILAGENLGEGNPGSFSKSELARIKTSEYVKYIGYSDDIPALFSNAHIVILPSYHEGFPKVLLEAAACARPVVTTDVPGCRDAIQPNITGLLVNKKDVRSLADAIKILVENPETRQAMGKAARVLAEKQFSIENVVRTHQRIYDNFDSQ